MNATGCGGAARIAGDLDALLAAAMPDRGNAAALMISRVAPGRLLVRLVYRAESFERQLAFAPQDCAELAQTVAVVVRGWIQRPVRSFAEAASTLAPPEPERRVPDPDPAPPVAPPPFVAAAATPPPPAWFVSAALAAFDGSDAANQGFAGIATVEWEGSARWGFVGAAGLGTALEGAAGNGSVTATPGVLAAAARFSPLFLGPLRLDLVAGPGLVLVWARTRGYAVRNESALLAQPAVTAQVRVRFEVGAGFAAVVAAGAVIGSDRLEIEVEPHGTALAISRAHAALSLGLVREIL